MNYHINITKKAETDLNEAANYIEYNLLNPKAADDFLDKSEEIVNSLSVMPKKHPFVDDPILSAWGIRFVTVNNYIAFYIIDDTTSTVHIIRSLYKKRNWIQLLKNEPSV